MGYSILYEEWMQRLLVKREELGVSQYVLEQFIRIWDERMVDSDGQKFLADKHAG